LINLGISRRNALFLRFDSLLYLRDKDHLVDPGVNERIILRLIFRKWDVVLWTGLSWLMIETGGGHF
jgi:hypothetical protein